MLLAMTTPGSFGSVDPTRSYYQNGFGTLHSLSVGDFPTPQRRQTYTPHQSSDWAVSSITPQPTRNRSYSVAAEFSENENAFRRPKSHSVTLMGSAPVSRSNTLNTMILDYGTGTNLKGDTITPISEVPDFTEMGLGDLGLEDLFKAINPGPSAGAVPPAAERDSRTVHVNQSRPYTTTSNGISNSRSSMAYDDMVDVSQGYQQRQQQQFAGRPITSYSYTEFVPAGENFASRESLLSVAMHDSQYIGQAMALPVQNSIASFAPQQHGNYGLYADATVLSSNNASPADIQYSPESLLGADGPFVANLSHDDFAFHAELQRISSLSPPPTMSLPVQQGSTLVMGSQDEFQEAMPSFARELHSRMSSASMEVARMPYHRSQTPQQYHQTRKHESRSGSPLSGAEYQTTINTNNAASYVPKLANSMSLDQVLLTQPPLRRESEVQQSFQQTSSSGMVNNATATTNPITTTASLNDFQISPGAIPRRRANTFSVVGPVSPPSVSQQHHTSPPHIRPAPQTTHTRMILPAQPLPVVKEIDNLWRRKRQRRSASQLLRNHNCPVIGCEKRYEAWRSLQHHLCLKHELKCKQIENHIIAMNADGPTLERMTNGAIIPAPTDAATLLALHRQQRKSATATNPLGRSLDDIFLTESDEAVQSLHGMGSAGALPLAESAESSPASSSE